jgi:hypothetical protein
MPQPHQRTCHCCPARRSPRDPTPRDVRAPVNSTPKRRADQIGVHYRQAAAPRASAADR